MELSKIIRLGLAALVFLYALGDPKIVSAQLPNQEGKGKKTAENKPKQTDQRQQEPLVPLSFVLTMQTQLSDALRTACAEEKAFTKNSYPRKDGWDKAVVIADFLLVIVGGLYSYFAWRQLDKIGQQITVANKAAQSAERSADAASTNTETMARLYSPYVEIDRFEISYDTNSFDVSTDSPIERIGHTVCNFGLGHAFLKERSITSIFAKNLPAVPEYSLKDISPMSISLKGGDPISFETVFPEEVALKDIDSATTDKFLFIYGYYVYDDIFDVRHSVWFAMRHDKRAFSVAGGSAYNHRESKKKNENEKSARDAT